MRLQPAQMPGERGLNGTSAMIRTISQQKYNNFYFRKIYFSKKIVLFLNKYSLHEKLPAIPVVD